MTNPTPRDSAQLPPLQVDALAQTLFAAWQKTPHSEDDGEYSFKTLGEMSSTYSDAWRSVAREALRAQPATAPNLACKSAQARLATQWGYVGAASVEPVIDLPKAHEAVRKVLRHHGLTKAGDGVVEADLIAAIVKLYAGAQPAHIPADATQPQAVAASSPATAVDAVDDDAIDMVSKALRRAWQLGQTYWQQADSESYKQQARSDKTQEMFNLLIEETRAALQASRQPQAQAQQGGGEGEVGYLYGFDRSDLSAMADGLDCHEQTVDGLQTTTAAAAQFIRAALQACAGDDAKILEWLLPNIHPANFGLDYDKEHYENDVVGAWKKAILNDLATKEQRS